MLLNSRRVKIDGLGTFFTTIENEPGGAAKKEDFSPQKNLKALHIRFMPDQEAETNISSREFIKKAEFVNAEAFAGMLTEDEPSNGSGSGSGSGSSQSGNSGGNTGGNSGGGNSGGGNSGGGGDDDDVTYD